MEKATFKPSHIYIGKTNEHYSRVEFIVVKIKDSKITLAFPNERHTFTADIKSNIEGQYCKINKIVVRASEEKTN